MSKHEALFLSLEDVIQAGGDDMGMAIDDVQQGFELFGNGHVDQPPKLSIARDPNEPNNFTNLLPAGIEFEERSIFGCKIISGNLLNPASGLPRALGLLALFDGETKAPLAVMDAQVVSAMRTGAVSGLAARYLVPADTKSVGLIGAGVNMRTQLLGIDHELGSLANVELYALGKSKEKFAREMAQRTGLPISPAGSPQEVIENNAFSLLCTTKPKQPIIEEEWLGDKGITVFNISGIATPPTALARMDRLVTDAWVNCRARNTQTLPEAVRRDIVRAESIEELGPIMAENDGRKSDDENIFFCPTGMAFEDVMVGWRVYQTARAKKIGQHVTLWADTDWI